MISCVLRRTLVVAAAWMAVPPVVGYAHYHAPAAGHGVEAALSKQVSPPLLGDARDHGEMRMQGGDAPPELRDPHGYSEGYTKQQGPYVSPAQYRPKLADERYFRVLLFDRLEFIGDRGRLAYDGRAWFGRTYSRLVLKTEGETGGSYPPANRTELLWSSALTGYWDAQLGLRYDDRGRRARKWLSLGTQGLAPYWFEIDVAVHLREGGHTALQFEAAYELLLLQRLTLQPCLELDVYSKADAVNGIGRGIADAVASMRLRYEFSRRFAIYAGLQWGGAWGESAARARAEGQAARAANFLAGLRFWF